MSTEASNPLIDLPVLVCCAKSSVNKLIRSALKEIGFKTVQGVYSHSEALSLIDQLSFHFRIVFFDAYKTNIEPLEFIAQLQETNPESSLIAVAEGMHVKSVFELLRNGARGFIVPPFTFDAVENSLIYAERVASIDPKFLDAKNVSEAVIEAMLNNFENLSKLKALERNSNNGNSSALNIDKMLQERQMIFRESADVAKSVLAEEDFVDLVMGRCINYAEGPLTRLGRLRRKLKLAREKKKMYENSSSDKESTDDEVGP